MAQTHLTELSEEEKKEFTLMIFDDGKPLNKYFNSNTEGYPEEIIIGNEKSEARVVFARNSIESDKETIGRSAIELEEAGKKWMTAKQRMIAGQYIKDKDREIMDDEFKTILPGSQIYNDKMVPVISSRIYHTSIHTMQYDEGQVQRVSDVNVDDSDPKYGAREIK